MGYARGTMSEDRRPAAFLRAESIAPVLPVRDVEVALRRFDRLGFVTKAYRESSDRVPPYGFVCFGPGEFHVARVDGLDPATTTSACYLYVDDVDVVFAEWSAAGVEGRLHAPEDTAYDLREMAYVDPDGNSIRVGSRRRSSSPGSTS